MVDRFIAFKDRTEDKINKIDELEKEFNESTMLKAIESSTKEAVYALDDYTPFRLYDCLVPELEAHRPLKLPISKYKQRVNHEALLKMQENDHK